MALWANRRAGAVSIAAAAWLGLIGCSQGPAKPDPAKTVEVQPDAPKGDPKSDNSTGVQQAVYVTPAKGAASANPGPTDDPLFHPFAEAALDANDPPAFVNMPVDVTVTGKPTFKLLNEVQQLWNEIRFTTPEGKRIDYTAVLDTDFGQVQIALRPDVAPNHVRSFVALIRAGYYDGMRFDRIHHEVPMDAPNEPTDFIEGGCPFDKGDPKDGSIGYWLKPEAGPALHHEIGAIGAMHGTMRDSAGCKFYIMLSDAPFMDGGYTVFGKVTKGLDVVRTIFGKPVIIDEYDWPGHNRPKDPLIIRKATVQTQVASVVK